MGDVVFQSLLVLSRLRVSLLKAGGHLACTKFKDLGQAALLYAYIPDEA